MKQLIKKYQSYAYILEGTHERLSEKFCDKEEEGEQTGETNEIEAYSSRAVDGLDENIQRRARTTIAAWQRQELECLFTKYRYPAFEQVEQLSERLGLPQYVIKVNISFGLISSK